MFQLTPAGVLTVLYNFDGNANGGNPAGALTQGRDGSFYGTTQQGGAYSGGTVYSITSTGTFTTLASFTGDAGGSFPYTGLTQGNDGNFYGTTLFGGTNGAGTIFRVTRAGVLKSLYSFSNGLDGGTPLAGLALGNDGNFYGATYTGGANNLGAIFRLRVIQTVFRPIGTGITPAATAVSGKVDARNTTAIH